MSAPVTLLISAALLAQMATCQAGVDTEAKARAGLGDNFPSKPSMTITAPSDRMPLPNRIRQRRGKLFTVASLVR